MAGRTERVNARDLLDRTDVIIFEGDTCREWIEKLEKRMSQNVYFSGEFKAEFDELVAVHAALAKAEQALGVLSVSVSRREGKAA